jgi:NADH:ubiquinone oxidoreductase subunit 5 (subunit L)/multisubunit Na+/H+ antiporter MnhA subunit
LFVILRSKVRATTGAHHGSALLEACRALPLVLLAVISVVVGLKGSSVFDFKLLRWLGGHPTHWNLEILVTTTALIVLGAVMAYLKFRDPEAAEKRLREGHGLTQRLLERKFFVDDAYEFLVRNVGLRVGAWFDRFDRAFVNGVMVNGTSYLVLYLGRWLSRLQSGLLQDYLAWSLAAGVAVLFWAAQLVSKGPS